MEEGWERKVCEERERWCCVDPCVCWVSVSYGMQERHMCAWRECEQASERPNGGHQESSDVPEQFSQLIFAG